MSTIVLGARGRSVRPFAEIETPMRAVPEEPGASDRSITEPLAHQVDRPSHPIRSTGAVEQRQLLRIGQGDGGEADEPHAAPGDQRAPE